MSKFKKERRRKGSETARIILKGPVGRERVEVNKGSKCTLLTLD